MGEIDDVTRGKYGLYGDYVYGEEHGPASDDYLDEQWAEVDGSGYFVSTHGRIWSSKSNRFIKPTRMDDHGHVGFSISCGNRRYNYVYLHREMAKAFIPNPRNYTIVRHLDDDPSNNYIYNLAWGTMKDNARDCRENGHAYYPTDEDRRKGNLEKMIPIIAINIETGERIEFESVAEAARSLGLQHANVWKVLHGKRPHTGGYSFVRRD